MLWLFEFKNDNLQHICFFEKESYENILNVFYIIILRYKGSIWVLGGKHDTKSDSLLLVWF